jgi:hypothetical protein
VGEQRLGDRVRPLRGGAAEANRRVIETNLLGTMQAGAALPHFRPGWLLLRKKKASDANVKNSAQVY